jgi:hypothetical protein
MTMYEPREPNAGEVELLTRKVMELWRDCGDPDEDAHHDVASSLVEESCVAVFDRWYFTGSVDDIDTAEIRSVLVVVWPQQPSYFEAFAVTHDGDLIRVQQSEDVREPVHVSTP